MTNRKNSARARLVASALAMLLCVAMLVGTTFAWFSDEAKTGETTITAGNLDVDIVDDGGQSLEGLPIFDVDMSNWEPGMMVESVLFHVKNNGSLALWYDLRLENGAVTGGQNLLDVIGVKVVNSEDEAVAAARPANPESATLAERRAYWEAIAGAAEQTSGVILPEDYTGEPVEGAASGQTAALRVVLFWNPSESTSLNTEDNPDNVYNSNKGGSKLSASFSLNVFATQTPAESDSFGKEYDADVPGVYDESWYDESEENAGTPENPYLLDNAQKLAGFDRLVNEEGKDFEGKAIQLADDIDLTGYDWTPIGEYSGRPFRGSFDGAGYTVSNITMDSSADEYTGFFGYVDSASIKDLTLENVSLEGDYCVGGLVGFMFIGGGEDVTISNVTVSGEIRSSSYASGIIGDMRSYSQAHEEGSLTIENCTNNATIIAENANGAKSAGIIGHIHGINTTLTNCTNNGDIIVSTSRRCDVVVGGIAGYVMRTTETKMEGCMNTGDITVTSTDPTKCNIGGIISTAHEGSFELTNVKNKGNVTVTVNKVSSVLESTCKAAVAGIVGSTSQTVNVTDSVNEGDVTLHDIQRTADRTNGVGGIFGFNDGAPQTITRCSNTGNIFGEGGERTFVGQFAGYLAKGSNILTIVDCGDITAEEALGGKVPEAQVVITKTEA